MKRISLISLMLLATAGFAAAQIQAPTTDVLGAHLNYGRGCPACHAPHSGANGNGINKSGDTTTGNEILWGEDVGNLYGKTILTGGTVSKTGTQSSYSETLPTTMGDTTPDVNGLLTCLSCHDGNLAEGAMMKDKVYESLPSTYGTVASIPTLLGNNGTGAGNYLNNHPVGLNATIGCGGSYNWDCTISATGQIQPGPIMTQFINDYGFFVSPGVNASMQPVVVCTTCHNQHLMNVVSVSGVPGTYTGGTVAVKSGASGLPAGSYATMFFIRAPYNPNDANPLTNQTAQFCRQCHGGESNEMNGGTAKTVF
ncbi:MAG: hypothetical protein ABSD44_00795 [Terracidiphilus sp.]